MKLSKFLAAERGRTARLARAIGVSPPYVSQMATGSRPVPPAVAVQIERITAGVVTRTDLRPDWAEIWPELQAQPAKV